MCLRPVRARGSRDQVPAPDLPRRGTLNLTEEVVGDVGADFGCKLAEFNEESNHVHLPVNLPPTVA